LSVCAQALISPWKRWRPQAREFIPNRKEESMKYGAQNKIQAKVKSVKKGDIMSLVKFTVTKPHEMASVLTTESVKDLKLKAGDQVQLIIKAIHVLPVKE
jgi:molybdate transport system regulatory protein